MYSVSKDEANEHPKVGLFKAVQSAAQTRARSTELQTINEVLVRQINAALWLSSNPVRDKQPRHRTVNVDRQQASRAANDAVAAGRGRRGHAPRAASYKGRHFEGRKYEILKFGRFWRIGVCIADSDILHPLTLPSLGTTPTTVSAPRPHTKQRVHKEIYTAHY